ncbi:MAG: hypothetical protein KAQ90_10590 [Melioribacteraceae bacterium]|nr:hypothetical protein [Melioribacteraceae bacterium]
MKKVIYFIPIFILLLYCGEKKEVPESPPKEEKVVTSKDKDTLITNDTFSTNEDTVEVKNILEEKEAPRDEGVKSIAELWKLYKDSKAKVSKALESNDIVAVIENLIVAAEVSVELSRPDIAAWQLNNIGHYSIEEFKRRTNYDNRLRQLALLPAGIEKSEYQTETKNIFKKELPLLLTGNIYLLKAQTLDNELEESRRTSIIESNLEYIEWVKIFVE